MSTPPIQWYPGHIAKAEKSLKEQLKRVDVVLEVRDSRIPLSAYHPQIPEWVGTKAKLLVLNRLDMVDAGIRELWRNWFRYKGEIPYFTDAQHGKGIRELLQATQNAGMEMNQRRLDRDMLPRPVRAVVIGFPNVGKSALINRLLGKRVVDSARRPGVTRQLRWIRISEAIELLDAPGVIPAKLNDQEAAIKLAICDDIGEAAYDWQRIAIALIEIIQDLGYGAALQSRYRLDPLLGTGDDYLLAVAEARYKSDSERAARQILNDFRKGILGAIPLELPPFE